MPQDMSQHAQHGANVLTMYVYVQTSTDTDEQTPVASSSDMGDADLDAIIDAGGSFDDQSATGAPGAYAAATKGSHCDFLNSVRQ